jgi:hypothetical protein
LNFSSVCGLDICLFHLFVRLGIYQFIMLAGSEGFDKIFTPDKFRKGTSPASTSFSPSPHIINESPRTTVESTVASLEEAVLDSQAKLAALFTDLSSSESSTQHLADIKQLGRKLESMQSLVMQLRTKI